MSSFIARLSPTMRVSPSERARGLQKLVFAVESLFSRDQGCDQPRVRDGERRVAASTPSESTSGRETSRAPRDCHLKDAEDLVAFPERNSIVLRMFAPSSDSS
jgi:hypothetical protein